MPRFRFTRGAEEDLQEIADFTRRTWGEAQCASWR
ncbi:MAG: type II toxin-antitoxin system RelE/ParE family toxin [Deltaproteobacteria bacterium]|nr:type II toxin-antitoxin system RelE/ParE family toxin [Deltaproteobacteria bacterium]